ncbi:glycosyl hydrolase [Paenibacillus mesotrionivorans]|uniref:Glycosyl hydrolase n=1 Tax=Paenibacillus mesotrionivorans TaxID=3160968 RepID=A0ACC7P2C9_9BACL
MDKLEQLRNPPAMYRSVPLWSWNDKLEPEELERQLEEMKQAGIGGFFMHARAGLETTYMEEEWMAAVDTCIRKSRELGLYPWLYDENGWPSGFADGKVPARGVACQQKTLRCEIGPCAGERDNTVGLYRRTEQGYACLPAGAAAEEADLRLYYEVNPYYIDTLSKYAVRAFLDDIHEVYWNRFGAEAGAEIKGVFTDEPQFARGQIPWSFGLEAAFRAAYGYDVKEALPALFVQEQGAAKHRYNFWECVTALFVEAYAKQAGEWCGERGWSSVGHVVDEQELMHQVTSTGDPMAFYEYLQIPGCDWLGRFTGEEPIVPKQVSSAARQLGKKQAITESFGCSGWDASFADLKRIGEWQFVHGINLLCQHLQGYSLRGLRKRDYPPSLFFQQPWWQEYRTFNDYFARLSMVLSEGIRQAQVLLLHPVRSAWVELAGTDVSRIKPYHEAFAQLTRWLCQRFVEHDYGSESLIIRHGRVEQGEFIIGEAAYRTVVLPPCATLSRRTLEVLKQFAAAGGRLVAFAPYPVLVDGEYDPELQALLAKALRPEWSPEALLEAVGGANAAFIQVRDAAGAPVVSDDVNVQTLEWAGYRVYYLVNSGTVRYAQAQVELCQSGRVAALDLKTGKLRPLEQEEAGGTVKLCLDLLPAGSWVLLQEKEQGQADRIMPDGAHISVVATSSPSADERGLAPAGCGAAPSFPIVTQDPSLSPRSSPSVRTLELNQSWWVTALDLNSLTLDFCRLRVESGEWSEPQPVILLQEQLLAYGRPVQVELAFQFGVAFDTNADRPLFLAVEKPGNLFIELNGQPVDMADCGWWRDTSFRKLNIAGLTMPGLNTVVVKTLYYNSPETYEALEKARRFESEGNKLKVDTELESIYVIGAFGVTSGAPYTDGERRAVFNEGPFTLTELPETVSGSDLVRQCFPFYAGRLQLEMTLPLDLEGASAARWVFGGAPDAAVCRLIVNGQEAERFLWEPYEADITRYLRQGDNTITLELANSCRNLLGPHHHIKGEVYKIGPDSFKDKPGWTDKDIPPGTSIWTDRYAFVRFGLPGAPRIELSGGQQSPSRRGCPVITE